MNPSALLLSSPVATLRSGFCIRFGILLIALLYGSLSFSQTTAITAKAPINSSTLTTPALSPAPALTLALAPSFISQVSASFLPPDSATKKRLWLVAGINIVGYGGSLIILNNTWYNNYARTGFHTFNDSKEWLQVDKLGHGWTAYNAGKISAAMWKWAGLPHKKAVWIGAASSTAYLAAIEFLDAHSSKWGWSWSDIAANFSGAGIFALQESLWNEQRVQYKFSFHKKKYDDAELEQRADDLFGQAWYERMLKDYNAQSYWMAFNIRSFFRDSKWPPWLNIAIGYGAEGMYGGFENKWTNNSGNEIDRSDIPRTRQFYLSPDIDFTKIKTGKKWLKTVFTFLNAFKCPAPALMLDSKGKFKAYALYF